MPARPRTHKYLTVSAAALIASAVMISAPDPAFAGKKTDKVLLGVAAGAAGLALLHALSKKKKARPPVVVAAPPPPRTYRPRPRRPVSGYYPRPRPRPPVYNPRPRAQYSAQTMQIQQSLTALGYNVGIADGLMGRGTRAGIRQFQASLGQRATGYMTPQQQSLLFQRAAGGARPPAPAPVGYPGYRPATPGYRPPQQPQYPVTGYNPPRQPVAPGYRPPQAQPYPVPGYVPPRQPQPVSGYRPISAVPGYPAPPSRGRGVPVAGLNPSSETTAALRIPAAPPPRQ